MADNLQVDEGDSSKFVRTKNIAGSTHVPLDGIILNDGNGNWSAIRRRNRAVRMSLENDEIGLAEENTLSSIEASIGDSSSASEERDPTLPASQIERLTALVSMLADVLEGESATDQVRVKMSGGGGVAQETTLSDIQSATGSQSDAPQINETQSDTLLAFIKGVVQRLNGTLTVTDDGDLRISSLPEIPSGTNNIGSVDIDGQSAGLATETTLAGLLSESRFEDVVNASNELKTNTSVSVNTVEIEADDGSGNVTPIERDGKSLQTAIQNWNAGAIGVSSLPTPVAVDATGQGDLPVSLGSESVDIGTLPNVTIGGQSAGLAQDSTLSSILSELQGALDVSGATVTVTDNGGFNVVLDGENAGLAQESTLTNLLTEAAFNAVVNASSQVEVDIEDQNGDLVVTLDGESVSVDSLPSLPSGSNSIGRVDVDSLPSLVISDENADLASDSTISNQSSYDRVEIDPQTDNDFSAAYNAIRVPRGQVDGDIEIKTGAGTFTVIPQAQLAGDQILPITVQQVSSTNTTQTVSHIMLLGN